MENEYDFSKGKRGPIQKNKGKTRITIYIDDAVLEAFRGRAEARGRGYQTLINQALRDYLATGRDEPLTETALRRILREELTDQYKLGEADG